MSNVYNLEPPTKGKVVLRTSLGDLDVELWAKEAPKAVRNFVQLCLEGYYDGTIFHRVIRDFMAQGGDPTGMGTGGESIYGRPFKDEVHSRLRFSHRGLLACANQNRADSNGSQFFITLDATPDLDRKFTIFGRVAGDTLYNLARLNDLEVGPDDRPEEPPKILRADVLWNPFEDIVPRVDREALAAQAEAEAAAAASKKKTAQRVAAKNFSLMSFGDEAEEENAGAAEAARTMRLASAHDALDDASLSKQAALEVDLQSVRERLRAAKEEKAGGAPGRPMSDLESRMRDRVAARAAAHAQHDATPPAAREQAGEQAAGVGVEADALGLGHQSAHGAAADRRRREGGRDAGTSDDDSDGEEGRKPGHTRSLPGTGRGARSSAAVVAPSKQVRVADADLLSQWEQRRKEYKERKRLGGDRQRDTLAKLGRFTSKLRVDTKRDDAAPPAGEHPAAGADAKGYSGKVRGDLDHATYMPAAWRVDSYLDGSDDDGDDARDDDSLASLRNHRLAFAKDAKDAMARNESVDDYVVVDPLLEAGKAKFSKRQQAERKRATQWAGRANN